MNVRFCILLTTSAFALASLRPVSAQDHPEADPIAVLSSARTGQWIQVEGVPQRDSSLKCTKIKLLVGDLPDSNATLRGSLLGVEREKSALKIGGYLVRLVPNAKYSAGQDTLTKIWDLQAGTLLKVKGSYLGSSAFLARKVDNESDRQALKPGIDSKIRVRGKIERIDTSGRSITVMGATFLVNEKTQVRSGAATADAKSD